MPSETLPAALAEIRDDFLSLEDPERLQLLLEHSRELPELPEALRGRDDLFEQVLECQAPVFIAIAVDDQGFHLYATAPAEAPTTRGFAAILVRGLEGLSADEVLAIPDDFPQTLGLGRAVSLLRLRGMTGMLARTKRLLRELAA